MAAFHLARQAAFPQQLPLQGLHPELGRWRGLNWARTEDMIGKQWVGPLMAVDLPCAALMDVDLLCAAVMDVDLLCALFDGC